MLRTIAGSPRAVRFVIPGLAAVALLVGVASAQARQTNGHKHHGGKAHHRKHHHRKHHRGAHNRKKHRTEARRKVDSTAPTAPQLAASAGDQQVALNWSPSTDNVAVKGYRIYRDSSLVAKVAASVLSYTDGWLQNGTVYTYVVKAYDRAGNLSPASNWVTAMPTALALGGGTIASSVPPSSSIYWGAWIDGNAFGSGYGDAPWDDNTWSRFEADAGKKVSIEHFGSPWQWGGTFQSFPQSPLEKVRQRGDIAMLDWGSWNLGASDQSGFSLSKITGGAYDSYIRSWAMAAKNWAHPFFLRFDWEMNGKWFPWGEGTNGNTTGQFAAMWRHVHDIFASVGATNVTWVWCPNTVYSGSTPLSGLYPGDAYVDWTGIDGYNQASLKSTAWVSFSSLIGPTYSQLLSLAPGKPIAIGETGSIEAGGSKATWLSDMLKALPSFPQIKALVYFNKYADGGDWPIESSSSATAAFAGGIAARYYAPGGSFANLPLLTKVNPL